MTRPTIASVQALQTGHGQGIPTGGKTYSHSYCSAAGSFRTLDQLRGHLEIVGCIQLVPERSSSRLRNVFDTHGRLRRENLQITFGLGRPRGTHFSITVKRALTSYRTQDD